MSQRRALIKQSVWPNAASSAVIGAEMQVLSWTDDEIAQLDSRLQQHRGETLTRLQNTIEQINASLQALIERVAQLETREQQRETEGLMYVEQFLSINRQIAGLGNASGQTGGQTGRRGER